MTAFEILLNKFYETIEKNEPQTSRKNGRVKSGELFELIRFYIDTSFAHGHNLSYKDMLSSLIEKAANLLQNTSHEEWEKVKNTFLENDLHFIRRDRNRQEVRHLKMALENSF